MPNWKKIIVSGSAASLNSLNVATNIVAQSFTGSLFGTASFAVSASQAISSSFATSASFSISASQAQNATTASYVLNAISASFATTASYALNADLLDGRDSTVFATTGSNIFRGNQTITGSLFTTGSNTLIGSTSLTGSLNITGSTFQTGNNTLIGNTLLSGSIIISGSSTPGSPTASVQIYGDIQQAGYHRFDPVNTNINNSISASYIYVSGSTNDLYFSQNSKGYSNTTRLRWLEGNLYTGLLHGGLITTQSSTIYRISSGSGIIVDLNASLNDDPYPTIQFLEWGNLSASIAPLTASYQQAFVGIDSTNNIYSQGTPFSNGQFDALINVGMVFFQNGSTINGVKTQPSVAYGFEQQQNIFNRAFGPLKLSGYTLAPSGSSTGSLIIASGTAYAPGSNYVVDPNEPSYTVDSGTNISKIFRYHQSGSTWVYNTNTGAGYTSIDPGQYSNNGTLASVQPNDWTIQRVFWFPNSITKAIVVYYGNAVYGTESEAIANISIESFVEAPNTAANAIYLGSIIIRGNGVFTTPADFTIVPGGLFRQVGGSGGGGSIITQTLSGLSDVNISGPTDGQALVYNTTQAKWINSSAISASITGNAATATSASFATTASYVLNAVSASFATTSSYAVNADFLDGRDSTVFATTGSNQFNGNQTITGSLTVSGSTTNLAGNTVVTGSFTVITGSVVEFQVTNIGVTLGNVSTDVHNVTGSLRITGSVIAPAMIVAGNTIMTGSLTVTGGVTTATELQVTTTGVNLGNISTDNHNVTGSLLVSGSTHLNGNSQITGSLAVTTAVTASTLLVSGSGTQRVIIQGSGSTQPIFTIQGSQGELFSITDSLSGSLFSVNDISGLPILEVFSNGDTLMGDYAAPAVYTTRRVASTTAGVNVIYSLATSSYDGVFVDYTIRSGSVGRAGNFMAMWSGSSADFTDNSINGFGVTTGFIFGASISGSNLIVSGSGSTAGWTVKTIIRGI